MQALEINSIKTLFMNTMNNRKQQREIESLAMFRIFCKCPVP